MSEMKPGRILWTAGLLDCPFEERLEAAVQLGYRRMSVPSLEAVGWLVTDPRRLETARQAAGASGVSLAVLDPVVTWLPTNPRWALAGAGLAELEAIGVRLGIEALCAIAGRDHGLSENEVLERFRGLCDLADRHGWTVAVEFAPMSGIPTLRAARELVEASGRANATVLFDSWHFFRGGGTVDELSVEDLSTIRYVQISDASADFDGSLGRDTYRRKLPGTGDFNLIGALRTLAARGALGAVGPEILREGQNARPALDRVQEEAGSLDALWRVAVGEAFLP